MLYKQGEPPPQGEVMDQEIVGAVDNDNAPKQRKPRATAAEMHNREGIVLKLIDKRGQVDAFEIAAELNLSGPQTMGLISRMLDRNLIQAAGRTKRRIQYVRFQEKQQVEKLEPADLTDALTKLKGFSFGAQLTVVGLHADGDTACLDLLDSDNKTVKVELV
jgi:hypothetical protein